MDDLAGKMEQILSNPEIMQQLQGLTGLLGRPEEKGSNPQSKGEDSKSSDDSGIPPDMMNMILKIAPLLSSMNKDDKYSKFLHSLRPLLSEPKQKKLDQSSNLLKLMKIIPLLKQDGIF